MERGLYIHIPFCIKKCNYCDFNSSAVDHTVKEEYLKSLSNEMILYSSKDINKKFNSVFIGGGTPSILSTRELETLFNNMRANFEILENAEITLEVNPGTVDEEKLIKLRELGVNRLSFGLQSSHDDILKYLGRIHTYEEFLENYKLAKNIGFDNINVDLMFAIPTLSIDKWKATLKEVVELKPAHISAYSLILEEGTRFYEMFENNEFDCMDEDLDLNMYHYAIEYLKEKGYMQYEISNFAKKGAECRHNIIYWQCKEYLGLGLGSHSYIENRRYYNSEEINDYMIKVNKNELPIINTENLAMEDRLEEKIFMGLRMNNGINMKEIKAEFGVELKDKFKREIEKLIIDELIEISEDRLILTSKGRDVSNKVFVEFLR